MSKNRKDGKPVPVAILTADLHLTLNPPACRDADSWMEAQADFLGQLGSIARNQAWRARRIIVSNGEDSEDLLDDGRGLPILCAGDVFDKWNVSPELVNFALAYLPGRMICVPGQHDLPNHRMSEMLRSGYGVLREAGKITCASTHRRGNVPSRGMIDLEGKLRVYGFGWNEKIEPPLHNDGTMNVALIHRYCWMEGYHYMPGQKTRDEDHPFVLKNELKGYRVAVLGDNHKGFTWTSRKGDLTVYNCGGFIRRKFDELKRRPEVGVLFSDGSTERHALDTSRDKFQDRAEETEKIEHDMKDFLEKLDKLGEHGLDFRDAVRRHVENPGHKIPGPVREIVLECLDSERK